MVCSSELPVELSTTHGNRHGATAVRMAEAGSGQVAIA